MEFFWFNSRYRFDSSPSDLGVRVHRSKLTVPTAERPVHSCPIAFQQPPGKKSFQILVHLPFSARIQLSQLKCLHPGFKMVRSLHLKNFPVLMFFSDKQRPWAQPHGSRVLQEDAAEPRELREFLCGGGRHRSPTNHLLCFSCSSETKTMGAVWSVWPKIIFLQLIIWSKVDMDPLSIC